MIPVRLTVRFRDGVLDPAAQAVQRSLHDLGYACVQDATLCKQIDLTLDETDPERVCKLVEEMCQRLLVNEVMETHQITVQLRADQEA